MEIFGRTRPGRRAALVFSASATLATVLVGATALPGKAQVVPTALPVYNVTQEGLTRVEGDRLAATFGIPNALRSNGSFAYTDGKGFQQVPSRQVGTGVDEDRRPTVSEAIDITGLAAIKPLDDASAIARADRILKAVPPSPDLTAKPSISHTQLTLSDKAGKPTGTWALDTSVTYALALGGLPVSGQGATVRATFAGDGTVTQLSDPLRRFERGAVTPIISAAEATAACAALYSSGVDQGVPQLGYVFPALTAEGASGKGTVTTLFPQYTCQPTGPDGPQAGRLVPAVRNVPLATLNLTRRGEVVTGAVTGLAGGVAPYAYQWSSSSTLLPSGGTGQLSYTRTKPRDGSPAEALTVQITDTNGLATTATVRLAGDGTASAKSTPGGGGFDVLSDVGIEQTVDEWQCAQDSANGFRNVMIGHGVGVSFDFRGADAWESDFHDAATGGNDSSYIDNVDAGWYTGHGSPSGFTFKTNHASTKIGPAQIRWGNRELEWMQLESCKVLKDTTGTNDFFARWVPTLDGLHMLNGFHTNAQCVGGGTGRAFAEYLFSSNELFASRPALKVRQAWANMAYAKEPTGSVYRSMGPMGPGGTWNLNDYFWGQGPTGADIPAAQMTGAWAISGTV